MATNERPTVDSRETLLALESVQRELAAWIAHVTAYVDRGRPGQILQAERSAGIVTASLDALARDTRAMARDAVDRALI